MRRAQPGNVEALGEDVKVPLSPSCGLYPGGGETNPVVEAMKDESLRGTVGNDHTGQPQ